MQGQDTQKTNVVSLFAARHKADGDVDATANMTAEEKESFNDVMERNRKNKERMEKERLSANKSVLRSYRIKN